ncbi:LysR family transcriptional regulator [Variovorax paradoxus]|jgi:DNA-binding transcriptional LysR family regulator|uniref:LysR family transcriptional regulator n=1 Tax=Variovorax TaxID=34072 RepID=UPI0006E4CF9C|nr:LysR family transcriptional regulator [Variovorax sp. CY25R-8]KPU92863.1 LysR family transcriptional regulator [Variovorax paradoxus]KPU95592.1 LysR family transcriptional regulator [Variovorax paradoxus]KPU97439.1 LysR family transcriptional regulator [Variovorax paradoxus]KPV18114.1 LysR family transcriptional regulator [Variovorax paradoxus]KPV29740.1 LysR family transcriptional regulator [Variovorax paradoxus]
MARIAAEEVSLQQLRALAAVAETGSFTLAAESLQLTQPAISHLVKRMEEDLGQPLVVRGRRIRMTDAGQMMVDTAVRALRLIDESVNACRSQAQLREGRVVLAVGHLTAGALMPPLLGRFAHKHPKLATTLLDSTAEQMISRILSQEADLGFGSDIGQAHSELATEPLFVERMALFVREDHPLAQRTSIEARQLEALPFIHVNPDANVWRAVSRQLSSVANVYPQVAHHVSMLSTAFGLIQAGAGVALLPRYVEVLMPPNLRVLSVTRPVLEYPLVAVRLAKHPLSPAAMAFLDIARQHLKPRAAKG